MHDSKQEVTSVVAIVKNGRKSTRCIHLPQVKHVRAVFAYRSDYNWHYQRLVYVPPGMYTGNQRIRR